MSTQDNQRGGIVIFAIIGVLLAGLLVGGLYMSKKQGHIAREGSTPIVAIDTEKEATKSGDTTSQATEDKSEADAPATAPVTPKPQTSTTPPAASATTPSQSSVPRSGPSEQLPSTGPTETFFSIVIVTMIALAGFVFAQSSVRLRRSALNR